MKTIIECKKNDFVVECCKCHKTRTEDGWSHILRNNNKPVSHTYCEPCFQNACDQLERLISK